MDLEWRIAVLLSALAVAGIGWWLMQRGRGRLRPAAGGSAIPTAVSHLAGERLTIVQVTSEYCASCARGARVWRQAVAQRPGAAFAEIDADEHMDLVRELQILTTPTALVYDGAGTLVGRVTGAPTPRAAAEALANEKDGALA